MRSLTIISVLAAVAPGAAALAQGAPPEPTLTTFAVPWVGYAVIIGLLALVMVGSLLPSKRGHQD